MYLKTLDQIFELLKSRKKQHLISAWAMDVHTIKAVSKAVEMGIVEATLVGDREIITGLCRDNSIDPGMFGIVHETNDSAAAVRSVELINDQQGNLLMKGNLSSDKYLRAILSKERGLMDPGSVLSHVTVMHISSYHKLLIMGDAAIIPQPDLRQKIAIANYLISTAVALGVDVPKLAVIAATEQVLTVMTACTDAAIISKMGERNQIKGAIVEGPLSLDLSINAESAKIKGISCQVAGDADCLLFPNIESGNIFYKANVQYGGSEQAAIIVGARVPAVLSSRGDSVQTKLNSIALAAMLAK
jgi:phosphate butyryltransferase